MKRTAAGTGMVLVFAVLAYLVWGMVRSAQAPTPTESVLPAASSAPDSQGGIVQKNEPPNVQVSEGSGAVSGKVTFLKTGEAAAGVLVTAVREDAISSDNGTRTNGDGTYTIVNLAPGIKYTLTAKSEDESYVAIERPVVFARANEHYQDINITLCPSGAISGNVSGRRITYFPNKLANIRENMEEQELLESVIGIVDTPLANVKVLLTSDRYPSRLETVSDASGRYAFKGLTMGSYKVAAEFPEGAVETQGFYSEATRTTAIDIDKPTAEDVDLHIRMDGLSISGRVTAPRGVPIRGAKIVAEQLLIGSHEGMTDSNALPVSTVTDEDGRYELRGVLPANWDGALQYFRTGELPQPETYVIRVEADGYADVQITVPAIDTELAGFARSLLAWAIQNGRMQINEAKTSEVILPAAQKGLITGIDFVLDHAATVSGYVTGLQGSIVSKCEVLMSRLEPTGEGVLSAHPKATLRVRSDDSGRFRFEEVAAGTYEFEVYEGLGFSRQKARNEPLRVQSGDVIEELALLIETPEERGRIHVSVVEPLANTPVKDYSLKVLNVDALDKRSAQFGGVMKLDGSNEAYINGVSAGIVTLEVSAPGYGRQEVTVQTRPQETAEATILLGRAGGVEGYITKGEMEGSLTVSIYRADSTPEPVTQVKPDEGGYYTIGELSPGRYLVNAQLRKAAGPWVARCESAWAVIESGAQTRVDLALGGTASIHGTISFPDEYDSAGVIVRDAQASGPMHFTDMTTYKEQARAVVWGLGRNDVYSIDNLPTGQYVVTAVGYLKDQDFAIRGEGAQDSWTIVLKDDENLALPIEIGTP